MNRFFAPSSFAAGILVGALIGYIWSLGEPTLTTLTPSDVSSSSFVRKNPQNSSSAISVTDQKAGEIVIVESVTVPPPGVWVAVREVSGADLGNVLGAARVSAPRLNVEIPLLRATEPGQRYAIQLYRDNGDGVFDLASDSVYVDFDTSERVVAYFTAY